MTNGMILTDAGRELLTLALTGQELHFTRGALGDGYAPDEPKSLRNLVSERKSLPIQSMRSSSTGTCECVVAITNQDQQAGFWLREYGLFALHPESGLEVLYAYCNKGDEAGYLEGYDGNNPISFALTLITVVDQASNITATINTENSYVTISRLEARVLDLFTHSSDIAGVWTYGKNSTDRLSPVSWPDFKNALMGVTDIEMLNSRLEHVENNLADTLLALELQSLYPDYTHYIIEDFRNPDQVDTFSCRITSIVAGDDSIDCNPIDGILPGSWYTVTDGISSENVQVHSVSLENGIQRIILESPISHTYNLETCRMFRTSAFITTNGAIGSGARKTLSWRPSLEWHGATANDIQFFKLDMSAAGSKGYSLSGSAQITNTGALTLSA